MPLCGREYVKRICEIFLLFKKNVDINLSLYRLCVKKNCISVSETAYI